LKKYILVIFIIIIAFASALAQNDSIKYSFFSAGHTYGHPTAQNIGLHPPFVNVFPVINSYQTMEFGVLLGDVVRDLSPSSWDAAVDDIKLINMPVFIAAGNHDISDEFTNRFGSYYYSFIEHDDLFIFITPALGRWNIDGAQKEFLINTVDTYADQVNNIFVMHHELIWWSPYNILNSVIINYQPDYPGSTNFWSEIEPIFNNLPNNVIFFAGDLGATLSVTPFMYYNYDNITMIGTGMGGGQNDNFIITDVYNDTIIYNLYALNYDDPKELGELTNYSLISSTNDNNFDTQVSLFPNPVHDELFVRNDSNHDIIIQLFSLNGNLLLNLNTKENFSSINFLNHSPGIYLVKIIEDKVYKTFRIIKK